MQKMVFRASERLQEQKKHIFWFFFTKVLHVEQETTPECYKQKYNHKKQDPYTYSVEKIKE